MRVFHLTEMKRTKAEALSFQLSEKEGLSGAPKTPFSSTTLNSWPKYVKHTLCLVTRECLLEDLPDRGNFFHVSNLLRAHCPVQPEESLGDASRSQELEMSTSPTLQGENPKDEIFFESKWSLLIPRVFFNIFQSEALQDLLETYCEINGRRWLCICILV